MSVSYCCFLMIMTSPINDALSPRQHQLQVSP
jgi:hypothetical protein